MIKITGKKHDLGGGMVVTRILPHLEKRTVGPFVFLDHMGPVEINGNQNTDVRPHPHIGLATLTYLFEGRIIHRDSSGGFAEITSGEVNWMTAGSGISHSERAHPDDKGINRRLHGLQFWIGLPKELEECEPSFIHYKKEQIPKIETENYKLVIIAGKIFDQESPVKTLSKTLFAEFHIKKNFSLDLSRISYEVALYLIHGNVVINNTLFSPGEMIVLDQANAKNIECQSGAHFVLIGGEPLESPRHLWWNFVSSNKERIELAKEQWKKGTFPMVAGETEFIPLPEK